MELSGWFLLFHNLLLQIVHLTRNEGMGSEARLPKFSSSLCSLLLIVTKFGASSTQLCVESRIWYIFFLSGSKELIQHRPPCKGHLESQIRTWVPSHCFASWLIPFFPWSASLLSTLPHPPALRFLCLSPRLSPPLPTSSLLLNGTVECT